MNIENVWDYPRPPRLEMALQQIRVVHRGITVADTRAALRILETSHPPAYYIPRDSLASVILRWVDDEQVLAQAGDFYGGWITANLRGPFKGAVGTLGW